LLVNELLIKIGDQMTTLNLAKLHVEVIEKKFPDYTHLVFDPSAKNHTNYLPTETPQPSGRMSARTRTKARAVRWGGLGLIVTKIANNLENDEVREEVQSEINLI
jgi:hypothetical protein